MRGRDKCDGFDGGVDIEVGLNTGKGDKGRELAVSYQSIRPNA